MKKLALLFSACACASFGQVLSSPGGGVGVSGPNPTASSAGAVTSLAITITSLNLTTIDPASVFCYTGTTTRTPFTAYTFTTSGSNPITTVTVAFSSTANITCGVNATGGAGAAGANGSNGSTWSQGSGAPSDGSGNNGDFYFRTATSDVYQKASGTWGSPIANIKGATGATGSTGAAGSNGTNGNSVLNGSGTPGSGTGGNGDFYVDTSGGSYVIYGPKSGGVWGSGTTLTGGGVTGLSVDGDGTVKASVALTIPAPSTPTYNAGGTTTCNLATSNYCAPTTIATSGTTLALTNPHGAGPYWITFTQPASSPVANPITFPGTMANCPQPGPTASKVTTFQFVWTGTAYQCLGSDDPADTPITVLSGDVTTPGSGDGTSTLATVNSNVGSCGDATHVCQTTFDGKGRATAATPVAITGGGGGNPAAVCSGIGTATSTVTPYDTILTCSVTGGLTTNGDILDIPINIYHTPGSVDWQVILTINGTTIATMRDPAAGTDPGGRMMLRLTRTGASAEKLSCVYTRGNGAVSNCDSQGSASGLNSLIFSSGTIAVSSTFTITLQGYFLSAISGDVLNADWSVVKYAHI